jgi:hypothetical protein
MLNSAKPPWEGSQMAQDARERPERIWAHQA